MSRLYKKLLQYKTDGLTCMLPYVIQYDHRGKILHRACFNRNTLDNGLFHGGVGQSRVLDRVE